MSFGQQTLRPESASVTVVGTDGSAGSDAAVDWAVQEARLRGGSVHVVVAWDHSRAYAGSPWGLGMEASLDSDLSAQAARIAEAATQSHDVVMTSEAVEGPPGRVLVDAARGAELLVVGSRGHGGFVGAMLGSVSQHVVTHSSCPVVVIPDPRRTEAELHRPRHVAAGAPPGHR